MPFTNSKKQSQKKHAKRRAVERYGLKINNKDLHQIVGLIHAGKAKFIEKKTHRISIFDVTFNDIECRVAYDTTRKSIASFVPKGGKDAG